MKHHYYLLFVLMIPVCVSAQSLSPVVIANTGGYSSSASGSVSFTAGETITPTLDNTVHVLTQGFQQPYKDATSSVEEQVQWTANAFPNPATHTLNVTIQSPDDAWYSWTIVNLSGATVQQSENKVSVYGESTVSIDVSGLLPGIYFLSLNKDQAQPYIVKFIKQ